MRKRTSSKDLMIPSTKKTYYQLRGKVHLLRTTDKAYCGVTTADANHTTTLVGETTCQKCLAFLHTPKK